MLASLYAVLYFKGALDKYNIYLFACCSREKFIINPYQKFQPIRPMRFHFIWFLAKSIIPECPIGPCIMYLLKSTSKNRNCYKYQYFSNCELNENVKISMQSLPMSTLLLVKKSQFFWKNWGMMLHLSSAPLRGNYTPNQIEQFFFFFFFNAISK